MSSAVLAASITGAGSVASSFISSSADTNTRNTQADIEAGNLNFNARLAEIQARSAEVRGARESKEELTKTNLLIGRQRARLAAQGIEIDSGSALDIQVETAGLGAVDALTIRNNAFREAAGFRIEAINQKGAAERKLLAAKAAARGSLLTQGLNAAKVFAPIAFDTIKSTTKFKRIAGGAAGRQGPLQQSGSF